MNTDFTSERESARPTGNHKTSDEFGWENTNNVSAEREVTKKCEHDITRGK